MAEQLTRAEVARRIGVSPDTLRRWADAGVVAVDGEWTPTALAQARIVARMRARGHSLEQIREAYQAEDDVLRGHAERKLACDVDGEVALAALGQRLRRENDLDL